MCCVCVYVALSFGETRTLVAGVDEPVSVRCAASDQDEPRWVKLTRPAADVDDGNHGDGGRVDVSLRRRLVLDAGLDGRDGVYLCILTRGSRSRSRWSLTTSARLAANLTLLSPCKYDSTDSFLLPPSLLVLTLLHVSYFRPYSYLRL